VPFARSLDLNGAVRHAIYSTGTGAVTTWKAGASYLIFDGLRLRATRSRDIRSANTLELFNPISQITNNTIYQGKSVSTLNIASGNTDLLPEVADTITFGAVVRPFRGLEMSLDYYNIDIKNAIGSIGSQRIIDECAKGNQSLCSLITVTPSNTLIVLNPTLNLSRLKNAGYDFEAQYTIPALSGTFSLRSLVNYRTQDYTQTLGSAPNYTLNTPSSPRWRGTVSARYATRDFALFAQTRWQGASALDPNVTIDRNHVPAIAYVDVSATYDFHSFGGKQQLFINIDNLTNRAPPISPPDVTTFTRPADPAYDPIGRYFTIGFRANF
jgi:outer membrane receptor protein involved in Fe transport